MSVRDNVKTTFAGLQERLANANLGSLTATYLFCLGDEGGDWSIKIVDGAGTVSEGNVGDIDCTVTVDAENFIKIVNKEANSQMMFMSGKVKVKGNMGLAMKLQKVLG